MPVHLISILTALVMLTFSTYGEMRVTTVPAASPLLEGANLGVTATDADGVPHIYLVDWATLPAAERFSTPEITGVHELLHVADRIDNGKYDGSLEPGGCLTIPKDCAHSWVYWALAHPGEATRIIDALH